MIGLVGNTLKNPKRRCGNPPWVKSGAKNHGRKSVIPKRITQTSVEEILNLQTKLGNIGPKKTYSSVVKASLERLVVE